MYDFVDKLIHIALPRTKDFRGISRTAVDDMGRTAFHYAACLPHWDSLGHLLEYSRSIMDGKELANEPLFYFQFDCDCEHF